ncbi:Nn.00g065690.m01.CDS01 [Neocucurbitaria sp. VM-36]
MANNNENLTSDAKSPILAGVIQIKIGDQPFFLSKKLLEEHAPDFPTDVTELEDVSVATFSAFVHWMGVNDDNERSKDGPGPLRFFHDDTISSLSCWALVLPLCKIFVFGVKYNISRLRKVILARISCCIEKIYANIHIYPGVQAQLHALNATWYTYDNTEPGSPLRKILVDGYCTTGFFARTPVHPIVRFPPEFLADLWYRRAELRGHLESRRHALECLKEWQVDEEDTSSNKKRKRDDTK